MDSTNVDTTTADETPSDHTEDVLARTSDVEHVQAEIAQTRASMQETLSAIQQKLDPHALMDHAKETVHTVVVDITDHAKETARDVVAGAMGEVKGAVGGAVDNVKDAVGDAMHTAVDSTKKAGSTVIDTVNRNPGAALLLLGAGWWLLRSRGQARSHTTYTSQGGYGGAYSGESTGGAYSGGTSGGTYGGGSAGNSGLSQGTTGTYALQTQGSDGSLLDTILSNPIPAALVVGTAVHLIRNHGSAGHTITDIAQTARTTVGSATGTIGSTLHQAGDKAVDVVDGAKDALGNAVGGAKDALGNAVGTVKDKIGTAAHAVQETAGKATASASEMVTRAKSSAGDLVETAGEKAKQAQSSLAEAVHANPLAAGVVALGIGAAIAMLLPDTEPENRVMGHTRDKLIETAQQSAGQLLDKVQTVSEKAIDAAGDAARLETTHVTASSS